MGLLAVLRLLPSLKNVNLAPNLGQLILGNWWCVRIVDFLISIVVLITTNYECLGCGHSRNSPNLVVATLLGRRRRQNAGASHYDCLLLKLVN